MNKSDSYFYIFTISGVLSILMGLITLFATIKVYWYARRSRNWLSASGNITEGRVVVRDNPRISKEKIYGLPIDDRNLEERMEFQGDQKNVSTLNTSFKNKGIIYDSHIEYRYTVNGKEYLGNQQCIGNLNTSSTSKEKIEQQVNKYTLGQEVIIYYDSSKPEKSSLSVGIERNIIVQFVFSFIFLLMGIALISLMVRIRRL